MLCIVSIRWWSLIGGWKCNKVSKCTLRLLRSWNWSKMQDDSIMILKPVHYGTNSISVECIVTQAWYVVFSLPPLLGTLFTDRQPVGRWSIWLWGSLALAVKMLSSIWWTTSGPTSSRPLPTWCSPSTMQWKGLGCQWAQEESCSTHYR